VLAHTKADQSYGSNSNGRTSSSRPRRPVAWLRFSVTYDFFPRNLIARDHSKLFSKHDLRTERTSSRPLTWSSNMPPKGAEKCPQCGTVAQAGQMFCGVCGARLAFCQACGATNLAWGSFCHYCGKAVAVIRVSNSAPQILSQVPSPQPKTNEELDNLVFEYLEKHAGEISLSRASKELNISQLELSQSISRLQEKGLIQRDPQPS